MAEGMGNGFGPTKSGTQPSLAMQFLRAKARAAHEDGDGVVVNLYCARALRDLAEVWKEAPHPPPGLRPAAEPARSPDVKGFSPRLSEAYWAIALPLTWLEGEFMLDLARWTADNAVAANDEEIGLKAVLGTVIEMLDNPQGIGEAQAHKLRESHFRWVRDESECEAFALANLAVELLWIREPKSNLWQLLADTWSTNLPRWIAEGIRELASRLVQQTDLLLCAQQGDKPPEPKGTALSSLQQAWWHLSRCNPESMQLELERAVNQVEFGSQWVLPLWGLKHFTSFWAGMGGKDGTVDSQTISLARSRLLSHSSPASRFRLLRTATFQSRLSGLLTTSEDDHATDRQLQHCFRLSYLMQLGALRAWDFAGWREATSCRGEVLMSLAIRRRVDQSELACEGIRWTVIGWSASKNDECFTRASAISELAPEGKRIELLSDLLHTPSFLWWDVCEYLGLLGDCIPDTLLPDVARWSLAFAALSRKHPRGGHLMPFGFWGTIFQFQQPDPSICRVLHPLVMNYGGESAVWATDDRREGFLRGYLIRAPLELAADLAERMWGTVTNDNWHQEARWITICDACEARPELMLRYRDKLISEAKTDLTRYWASRLDAERKGEGEPKHEILREWCNRRIEGHARSVVGRKDGTRMHLFSGIDPRAIIQSGWSVENGPVLDLLLEAIQAPMVESFELHDFLQYLIAYVRIGPPEIAERVGRLVLEWLVRPPLWRKESRFFLQNANEAPDSITAAILHLWLELADRLPAEMCRSGAERVAKLGIDQSANVAVPIVLIGLGAALREEGSSGPLLATSTVLRMEYIMLSCRYRPGETDRLAHLMRELAAILEPGTESWRIINAKNPEARAVVTEALCRILPMLAVWPDADVRAASALVLAKLHRSKALPVELEAFLDRLAHDPRARVRKAVGDRET